MKFLLNLIFGCPHQRTSFPLKPKGALREYVVCLDCGKEFTYDWQKMRVVFDSRGEEPRSGCAIQERNSGRYSSATSGSQE